MLTGIIKPDSGKAYILGYNIQKEPLKAKEHLGVVPETSNAYVDLSAWQNLILTADLYGVHKKDAEKRADDLLKEFDLYERRNDKVKGFSKGMKQRLILAMALINDPQLLFLDEPTSGLDVQSSILIRQMLLQLREKGKTILLTTHNLEEANKLCERIAIINKGKIAAIDTPENLKKMIKKLNTIEVTFDGPINVQDLSDIPEIQDIRKTGDKFILNTNNINNLISAVTGYAKSKDVKIVALNTLDPSLEEVFIELTRRS